LRGTDLDDPGVATRALGEARSDLGEQMVHDLLVPNRLHHLTTGVQILPLGNGHQSFGVRSQPLGPRLGRTDPAVLEQSRGEVGQHQSLMG